MSGRKTRFEKALTTMNWEWSEVLRLHIYNRVNYKRLFTDRVRPELGDGCGVELVDLLAESQWAVLPAERDVVHDVSVRHRLSLQHILPLLQCDHRLWTQHKQQCQNHGYNPLHLHTANASNKKLKFYWFNVSKLSVCIAQHKKRSFNWIESSEKIRKCDTQLDIQTNNAQNQNAKREKYVPCSNHSGEKVGNWKKCNKWKKQVY